jgi:hypothetical protein
MLSRLFQNQNRMAAAGFPKGGSTRCSFPVALLVRVLATSDSHAYLLLFRDEADACRCGFC